MYGLGYSPQLVWDESYGHQIQKKIFSVFLGYTWRGKFIRRFFIEFSDRLSRTSAANNRNWARNKRKQFARGNRNWIGKREATLILLRKRSSFGNIPHADKWFLSRKSSRTANSTSDEIVGPNKKTFMARCLNRGHQVQFSSLSSKAF